MRQLFLALYLVALVAVYLAGKNHGADRALLGNALAELQAIEQIMVRGKRQFDEANETSQHLLEQMQQRTAQDQKTTQELRNVLAQTADSRTDCSIPADVMRYLYEAHAAAAEATTSRLDAAVPSTGAAGE